MKIVVTIALFLLALGGLWVALAADDDAGLNGPELTGASTESEPDVRRRREAEVEAVSDPNGDAKDTSTDAPHGARVRVLDHEGRPVAGIQIGIEVETDTETTFRRAARSDSNGHLTLPALESYRSTPDLQALRARVVGLFAAPVAIDIPLTDDAPETLVLALPPFGAARVRITGVEGEEAGGDISLAAAPRDPIDLKGQPNRLRSSLDRNSHEARLFPIGLGLELKGRWQPSAEDPFTNQSFRGVGPRVSGEDVLIEVPAGRTLPSVRLRLVDEQRHPLAKRRALMQERIYEGEDLLVSTPISFLETDADGFVRVRLDLTENFLDRMNTQKGLTHRLGVTVRSVSAGGLPARAEVTLPGSAGGGLQTLGEVVLEGPPLVVGGQAVDANGSLVLQGDLEFRIRQLGVAYSGTLEFASSNYFEKRGASGFAFHSFDVPEIEPDAGVPQVRWVDGNRISAWTDFAVGDDDLVLRVRPAGSLRGRLLFLVDMIWRDLGLEIEGLDDDRSRSGHRVDDNGHFDLKLLPPGRYRVDVRPTAGFPVTIRDEIVVMEGGATDLGQIDLSSFLRRFAVTATTKDGDPVPKFWLMVEGSSGRSALSGIPLRGPGRAVFFDPRPRIFARGTSRAFLSQEALLEPGETRMTLRSRINVQVTIDVGDLELPPGFSLEYFVYPASGPRGFGFANHALGRDSRIDLETTGDHVVATRVSGWDGNGRYRGGSFVPVETITAQEVKGQVFRLSMSEARRRSLEATAREIRDRKN